MTEEQKKRERKLQLKLKMLNLWGIIQNIFLALCITALFSLVIMLIFNNSIKPFFNIEKELGYFDSVFFIFFIMIISTIIGTGFRVGKGEKK